MVIWRLLRSKQHSLAQQYLYFTVAIISIILVVTLWVSYSTYQSYQEAKNHFIQKEALKLNFEFDEKITYAEHLMRFLGTKIRLNEDQSNKNISEIIKHHKDNFKGEIFTWHILDYVDANGDMVADSMVGLRKKPIKVTKEKRAWLKTSREQPWHIQFSKPDIGLISGDYVISTGLGIYDHDKGFLGYLSAGLSIEKFTSRLLHVVEDEVSFVIFDEGLNFITSSEPSIDAENFIISTEQINEILHVKHADPRPLSAPIKVGDYIFTHNMNSAKYPFVTFIGQNDYYYHKKFKEDLVPKIIRYITLGVVFTSMLLFLGYQVIRPIIELGRTADAISKGRNVDIPTYKAKELSLLSNQLSNIQSMTKDLKYKQTQVTKSNHELENANEFIKSNMSFLSHELRNPVASIIGFAQMLKKKLSKSKEKDLKEYVAMINKAAIHQNKQLNFFLRLFEFQEARKKLEEIEIDLKEIIEWNVSMIRHHARKNNIKIHIDAAEGLPKLLGDEVMIGQLIQNLAANGAKYNKLGGDLIIKAYKNSKDQIIMQFTDTGIGIAKKDIDKIFRKFTRIKNKDTSKTIGYGIGLAYAKECVLAHGGKIDVKSTLGKGTTFTVTFPKSRIVR